MCLLIPVKLFDGAYLNIFIGIYIYYNNLIAFSSKIHTECGDRKMGIVAKIGKGLLNFAQNAQHNTFKPLDKDCYECRKSEKKFC